jgi:hydroxymethylpyrimidine pyrophosphatase-like HAD family hydrolase
MGSSIKWNDEVKIIISDVDETIADLYVSAEPEMIKRLETLLEEGKMLFLISGQSVQSIQKRIVNHIKKELRRQIIIGHCSGAEVWGFNKDGNLQVKPFYSLYENCFSTYQKKKWREIIKQLISEFKLKVFSTMPIKEFEKKAGDNPLAIMVEYRGPQITFEIVNGYKLSSEKINEIKKIIPKIGVINDLRIPILNRAEKLFKEAKLPITPRLAGVFALDFTIKGVSKTTSIKYVVKNDAILSEFDLTKELLNNPRNIEIWGDKFSKIRGGTDRYMSEALPKEVRSISFRKENPKEFPKGYNIVIWNGKKHLHKGLLEYLKTSSKI